MAWFLHYKFGIIKPGGWGLTQTYVQKEIRYLSRITSGEYNGAIHVDYRIQLKKERR